MVTRSHPPGHSDGSCSCLRQFAGDERGSIGMFYGLVSMVAMLIVGVAIDYGRTELENQRMQRAADAAALAASHHLGLADQDTAGPAAAQKFFQANTGNRSYETLKSVVLDANSGQVTVNAGGSVVTTLMNVFGYKSLGIQAASQVVKGTGTLEIALVLDNSGSMAGQPMTDLITAAQNLVNVVFTGATQTDRVKVGVVPFTGAVNVGSGYKGSSWIDNNGVSPLNGENFDVNTPRFTLYGQMGVAWKGCVESRPEPHDATDSAPDSTIPATLFVPTFAPDEPDSANSSGSTYYNSYISDSGGTCPPQPTTCLSYSRRGTCLRTQTTPIAPAVAQARVCKYQGATIGSGVAGPNYMCDSQPLKTLSSDQASVNSMISTMVANGSTNIMEGLMWGWRVLSPNLPFANGRPYSTDTNQKIIVLMTDGENTYSAYSNQNKSWYAARGYATSGRVGTTYTSTGYVNYMDARTLTACTNAKAAGVRIYTVVFQHDTSPVAGPLLQSCATDSSMAFSATNGAALLSIFQHIGVDISNLRISG